MTSIISFDSIHCSSLESEPVFIFFTKIIGKRPILFRFFSCNHFNDTLSKNPTEITHKEGEKTSDTISKDYLEVILSTRYKQDHDTNDDKQKNHQEYPSKCINRHFHRLKWYFLKRHAFIKEI